MLIRFIGLLIMLFPLQTIAAHAASADADSSDANPVTTVGAVDLDRYVGRWFEIARVPNRFQKQCARGTTAEYTVRDDGSITVVNRCIKEDGSTAEAEGVAKVVDMVTRAKLKVSFVSFLGWRPFWGDYWVIGLAEDYTWAVVGTPDRKYGWILGRTPALDEATMTTIFAVIERNGYRRSAFEMSVPGE